MSEVINDWAIRNLLALNSTNVGIIWTGVILINLYKQVFSPIDRPDGPSRVLTSTAISLSRLALLGIISAVSLVIG